MQYILVLLCFLLASTHHQADFMAWQWSFALSFCTIPIALWLRKKFGFLFSVTFLYYGISAICVSYYEYGKYLGNKPQVIYDLSAVAQDSILTAILLFLAAMSTPKKVITTVISFYTVINALYVIWGWKTGLTRYPGGLGYGGFYDYAGQNGALMAACLGFLVPTCKDARNLCRLKVVGLALTLIAIGLSKSAIPFGVAAVTLTVRTVSIWGLLPMSMGYAIVGNKMLQSSHRFEAYRVFLSAWWDKGLFWCGSGLGTYRIFVPEIQMKSGFMINPDKNGNSWLFMWLHSDWLQSGLFEGGVIGFSLLLMVYLAILKRFWQRRDLHMLSLAVGLGSSAVFDYPIKWATSAFLIAFIAVQGLEVKFVEEKHTN